MKYSSNGTVTLVSPLVDIAPLRSPMLKFWMMSPDGPVALDVMVSADQGLTWDILRSLQAECAAWECVTFGLDRYASANRLQVAFKAATRDYNDMMLDNIRLTDSRAIDLGVVSFSGPERVVGGTVAAYPCDFSTRALRQPKITPWISLPADDCSLRPQALR